MTGLECELECTVIEIISCHGDVFQEQIARSHMGRECSVILTHQRARPLNLNRFQLLWRMQLNLFLISASAKEQNFPADFNLTQAGPASAQMLFSTNIHSSYSPTLQLYFLIFIFHNSFPPPAGSHMSPCPGENSPPPFRMAARSLWLHFANTRNTAFIIIGVKKKRKSFAVSNSFLFPPSKPVPKYNSCQLWVVPWNATINSSGIRRQTGGSVNNGIKVYIFNPCDSHLPLHMYNPNQESDTD